MSVGGASKVNILSYNPGHDGAIALLQDYQLKFSIEAEKDSNYRYSPISSHDVFGVLGDLDELPDVVCTGGWWPRDNYEYLHGANDHVGYRGVSKSDVVVSQRRFLGKPIHHFSSSHERSHLFCAFGMSDLPAGSPCYALIWEGSIGAFYEIDSQMNITLLADVMNEPGNRYALLYGLADPAFDKNALFARHSDAGKLMALASYSTRRPPSAEDQNVIEFLLQKSVHLEPRACKELEHSRYYNVGVDDPGFRNLAGLFSDKIFDAFYQFAKAHMKRGMPLIIAGGCGLNCDWNSMWRESGLFSEVFVPPVANDSGSAIGTAIDAQFHFTGKPKIAWSVYSGRCFITDAFDAKRFDVFKADPVLVADLLAHELVLAWVSGRYEIGPRALGNRSILAAPFSDRIRVRLNEIKQREQFRPIAPVCLESDAEQWFGCNHASPYMLYTQRTKTDSLAAVTHVNGTARLQTVTHDNNRQLHDLLNAFKAKTGYGVLCNTSLNLNGKGFINKMSDLSRYTLDRHLDGFVVEDKVYLSKDSKEYQALLRGADPVSLKLQRQSISATDHPQSS